MITQRYSASEAAGAFADLWRTIDSQAVRAIQQRNLEAFARVMGTFTETAAVVGERQLDLFKAMVGLADQDRAQPGTIAHLSDVLDRQYRSGKAVLEVTAGQMRGFHDLARNCYERVTREIEACTHDNLSRISASMDTMQSPTARGKEQAEQTVSNAASQAHAPTKAQQRTSAAE